MINRLYDKQCDSGRLTSELVTAGLILYPNAGARFYGVTCSKAEVNFETTVMLFDDLTQEESAIVDTAVANHIPIPLPVEEPPKSEDNKPYVRAEVRPLDCTTYFTNSGDIVGNIGGGKLLYWDFSNSEDIVTAPTGYKRKRMDAAFLDFVYLKAGVLTVKNIIPGSYMDFYLVAPAGSYIMYGGAPYQLPVDITYAHFVNRFVCINDDTYVIEPQTISGQVPAGWLFRIEMTVPDTDVISKGTTMIILYRQRTTI